MFDKDIDVPLDTKCHCDCGWHGQIKNCELEDEQDGWENPVYKVFICPSCGDTDIIF